MILHDLVTGIGAKIRRARLLADAVRRLGPRWLLFRLKYAGIRRLGLLERRSPVGEWGMSDVEAATIPDIIDVDSLTSWLRTNVSATTAVNIVSSAADVHNRRFNVFGNRVVPVDWHHDPVGDVRYPSDRHWSKVGEQRGADIKYVWEPSRFAWGYDLVRAHLLDPDAGHDDVFWEVFAEWRQQNPPNIGVNWACGQESSIRLIAVVAAASGLRESAAPDHATELQEFAWVTARRVAANIAYARSQRNNHHASEAVGLLTAALLFRGDPAVSEWRRLGERHLLEVCDTLVFNDGSTSQYSTNYHRVFVHDLVWAVALYRSVGEPPPLWLLDACGRATGFLAALVEPISGEGPFYGHDDGSRILPLSRVPHRNLAEDVRTARAVLRGRRCEGDHQSEGAAWLGLADANMEPGESEPAWVQSFPDAGFHVLGAGTVRAYIRAGTHRFRPAQDDLLNCDVWVDGVNVLPDSGTASYGPPRNGAAMLDASGDHNGPRHPDRPLMRRASRFLWADWASADVANLSVGDLTAQGEFVADERGAHISRRVRVWADGVEVVDSRDDDMSLCAVWRVIPDLEKLDLAMRVEADSSEWGDGIRSAGYGGALETPAVRVWTRYSRQNPLRMVIERSVEVSEP